MRPTLHNVLSGAAVIGFILLAFAWGARIDLADDVHDAEALRTAYLSGLEQGRQKAREELLPTVRDAYRQGLEEGAQRERARGAGR